MNETDDLTPGSLVRRWRLGKQLRDLREAAGKTQDDAAEYLGVRRPTISRIENGRHSILPKNVRFLCQLYDIGAPQVDTLIRQAEESNERGWWVSHSDTMPDWHETYVGFEADAKAISVYESELVYGLLQVPSYTRAVRSAFVDHIDEAELAKSIAFRQERQRHLEGRQPDLRIILNESAIRRPVGDMREQLEHLVKASEWPYLTLQILPFAAGPHPGMTNPFSLLTLPDEPAPNFVYLEHADGAIYLERPADLTLYAANFQRMSEQALSPEDTRALLTSLVDG
ncbi:helix-turn-helix domain-containing protein [Actinokineospora globicatena]|uniref:helix-turn-helix domain-containing protein n=1 Tax=Actinokineospora globicatena TaxID=103729 RepID=UPI0020A4C2C2|nr:helix-turn-helix transcriptional regulator [Actinokineospora globicatena]MCP2306585.1 Transcriptional regulator, contains XRE-family HTH domain [Actinokineospora globicatena]GLW82018.1 transcriptional regulator [Actinokineospora globicatena]GLW88812.1 transcriptional regulator [Actinokineospora globicatena]